MTAVETPPSPVTSHANAPLDFSCLVVEDDPDYAGMLAAVVRELGGEPRLASNLRDARERLARRSFDLVLLDNHLPDGKGFDFYGEIVSRHPAQIVVVLTGLPELSQAVELTRHGLFDYLAKPVDHEALSACLRRACLRLGHRSATEPAAADLVASTPAMRAVVLALQQAARHPTATVLFTGETGTGKDAAAQALHRWTFAERTAEPPFVALNCAAVPSDMFEAELFGVERGAYTGADRTRPGLAGAAATGTLFLDEIGEVPLPIQAKLLRFLEAREYRPLGATASRRFDGRLVAATNRDLRQGVAAGTFREDLLYRLDVFTIPLPPLRERRDEIPALAELLLAQLARKYQREAPRLQPADLEPLRLYPFPGNVRELRNLLERSLLRTPADSAWLTLDHAWLNRAPVPTESSPIATPPSPATVPAPRSPSPSIRDPQPTGGRDLPPLEAQEYEAIRQALVDAHGGIRRAAAKLGITHQALLRRLEKWPELRPTNPPPA